MKDYKEKHEPGIIVTATRTFNRETITGEFGGFHLLDKSNPKSIVGVVHTPNGSYDVEPDSIESVFSKAERIRKFLHHTFTAQYLCKDKLGKWHGEPVTNIPAWLENKCEQKPTDKVEPKFKVKYAGNEYNVLEIKDTAGVTYYGIEDEPNHIDYIKAESCEMISGYTIKENGLPYPTKPVVFSKQKTDWSEEDEMMLECVLDKIGDLGTGEMCKEWLKSLKGRVQPQPKKEWNEEDKKLIDDTCHLINTLASGYGERVTEPITLSGTQMIASIKNRLRALVDNRPQNIWKPSDEQVEAVRIAAEIGTANNSWAMGVLKSMYQDLKKLIKL